MKWIIYNNIEQCTRGQVSIAFVICAFGLECEALWHVRWGALCPRLPVILAFCKLCGIGAS